MPVDSFSERVIRVIGKIPKGKAATYGQIAAMVYSPRAARMVGQVLRHLPRRMTAPWHRVIIRKGMMSIENLNVPKPEQARRLQEEGIAVSFRDGNYWVDLKKYLWNQHSNFRP